MNQRRGRAQAKKPAARLRLLVGLAILLGAVSVLSLILVDRDGNLWRRVRAMIPGQVVKVLVVEGSTGLDIALTLEERGVCASQGFLWAFRDRALLNSLGISASSAEGYLAPAKYDFFRDSRPEKVLARMVRRRKADFSELKGLTPPEPLTTTEEVLVLASLVEAEAQRDDERTRIAAVFVNRLRAPDGETHGRLQSDPSAAYGCRITPDVSEACIAYQAQPKVTPALLRDSANPYNTYRRSGLPPGPISNPGLASLRAAFSPDATSDLYFVSDGRGRHRFAENYAEHQKNVAELSRLRQTSAAEALPEP